jgi:hypothetical protein
MGSNPTAVERHRCFPPLAIALQAGAGCRAPALSPRSAEDFLQFHRGIGVELAQDVPAALEAYGDAGRRKATEWEEPCGFAVGLHPIAEDPSMA